MCIRKIIMIDVCTWIAGQVVLHEGVSCRTQTRRLQASARGTDNTEMTAASVVLSTGIVSCVECRKAYCV